MMGRKRTRLARHGFGRRQVQRRTAEILPDSMHSKRVSSIGDAVVGSLEASSLSVSAIGAGLALNDGLNPKHAVKQVGPAIVPAVAPRYLFIALSDVGKVDVLELSNGTRVATIDVPGIRVVSSYWRQ